MARRTCVQPSLLVRLATVSVWQRAVNRQPGYRSGTRRAGALPLSFSRKFEIFKKIPSFFNFFKSPGLIELWNFNVNTISINFNMCFTTIIVIHTHFQKATIFRNYFFMVKSICVQPPLLARLATVSVWQRAVNRQPSFRSGNSKGRSPSSYHFLIPQTKLQLRRGSYFFCIELSYFFRIFRRRQGT